MVKQGQPLYFESSRYFVSEMKVLEGGTNTNSCVGLIMTGDSFIGERNRKLLRFGAFPRSLGSWDEEQLLPAFMQLAVLSHGHSAKEWHGRPRSHVSDEFIVEGWLSAQSTLITFKEIGAKQTIVKALSNINRSGTEWISYLNFILSYFLSGSRFLQK